MKKSKIVLIIIIVAIIVFVASCISSQPGEMATVKSEKELYQIYRGNERDDISFMKRLITMPFSFLIDYNSFYAYDKNINTQTIGASEDLFDGTTGEASTNSKDYSETNIQVEGVDEADILKTDGDYIYSISNNKVIITNVNDPNNPIIESTIYDEETIPNELLLYKNKIVIISSDTDYNSRDNYYHRYYKAKTIVEVYDLTNKRKPKLLKNYELNDGYYSTRCIDGKLYVFANGYLKEANNKVKREYKEDNKTKEIPLKNIHYIKDKSNYYETLIAELDLNDINDVKISSYLINITNAYISKNNIYLLNMGYNNDKVEMKSIFGWKGIFGLADYINNNRSSYGTKIYKFNIDNKKGVKYQTHTHLEGKTINQYSLDEKDDNLRVALETYDGTRITVLDKNLKLLGETEKLEENENMYASRFIGDKAYLVTYRNTDPLFVIDLSNPKKPIVLGELKIPGYSTYLHPYDENHLIGIGIDTKETINRGIDGTVYGTSVRITGMKMCLFDVSDVNNPVEIDKTTIGDTRTVSAVLTNPKALLFSKEKELLAIPVNNYQEDFSIDQTESYEEEVELFKKRDDYISEGYFVYHIDLKGFDLKGVIKHERNSINRYYYNESKLLRGLYIDDNLYTVSETEMRVNSLNDLKELSRLIISKGDN